MPKHHLEIERRFVPEEPLANFPKGTKISWLYQSHLGDGYSLEQLIANIQDLVISKLDEKSGGKQIQKRVETMKKRILKAFSGEKKRGGKYKIRVRMEKTQKGIKSVLTCKRKISRKNSKLAIYKEVEIKIPEEEARFLVTLDGVVGVRKIRYRIPTKRGRIWEYNKHLGTNHGVNTIDVELPKRKSKTGKSLLGKVKELSVAQQKANSTKTLQDNTIKRFKERIDKNKNMVI